MSLQSENTYKVQMKLESKGGWCCEFMEAILVRVVDWRSGVTDDEGWAKCGLCRANRKRRKHWYN